jgi:hypothetical protein
MVAGQTRRRGAAWNGAGRSSGPDTHHTRQASPPVSAANRATASSIAPSKAFASRHERASSVAHRSLAQRTRRERPAHPSTQCCLPRTLKRRRACRAGKAGQSRPPWGGPASRQKQTQPRRLPHARLGRGPGALLESRLALARAGQSGSALAVDRLTWCSSKAGTPPRSDHERLRDVGHERLS